MAYNYTRLENFLRTNEDNDEMWNDEDNLYKAVNGFNKNGSDFSDSMYQSSILYCAYLYIKKVGLNPNEEKMFGKIDRNLTFEEFIRRINQLKSTTVPFLDNRTETLYARFYRVMGNKVDFGDWGWIRFYRDGLIKDDHKTKKEDEEQYRIYLPVKNKDLHKFALQLMIECENQGITWHFKTNNSMDNMERCDNVVIYTGEQDFPKHISVIQAIRTRYPEIEFGHTPLLASNYNDYIAVAPESAEIAKQESYTSNMASTLQYLRGRNHFNIDAFVESAKKAMSTRLARTEEFIDTHRDIPTIEPSSDLSAEDISRIVSADLKPKDIAEASRELTTTDVKKGGNFITRLIHKIMSRFTNSPEK